MHVMQSEGLAGSCRCEQLEVQLKAMEAQMQKQKQELQLEQQVSHRLTAKPTATLTLIARCSADAQTA